MKKWGLVVGGVLIIAIFIAWLFIESSKPLPGERITDLGRDHVPIGEQVKYNSNPPTSGPHYEDWVRSGVYEIPKDDGYLVHSLEHGYVIMSYNCEKQLTIDNGQWTFLSNLKSQMSIGVYAHGVEEEASPSAEESTSSATFSDSFRSDDCHKLVDQLISIYEKKGKTRIIVVPRPNMDTRIALTAWNYIDKLNEFDAARIEKFIDAHLNQGPEKTME